MRRASDRLWQGRRIGRLFLMVSLSLGGLAAAIVFLPLERYRPSCGADRWYRHSLAGPLRPDYLDFLTKALREERFFHLRIGDELFVRYLYPERIGMKAPEWQTLGEFLTNVEWRFAENIRHGYRADGHQGPPPPAVVREEARIRDLYLDQLKLPVPVSEKENEDLKKFYASDCELFQAAVIRVENIDPQDREVFLPLSRQDPQCDFRSTRTWDLRCGRIVTRRTLFASQQK